MVLPGRRCEDRGCVFSAYALVFMSGLRIHMGVQLQFDFCFELSETLKPIPKQNIITAVS